MKVGSRITAMTSAIVAVALGGYAIFDLRGAAQDRRDRVEEQARALALSLRAQVEARGVPDALGDSDTLTAAIEKAGAGWRVRLWGLELTSDPPASEHLDVAARLKKIIKGRPFELIEQIDDTLVYAAPLRIPSSLSPDGFEIAGSIEVSRDISDLRSQRRGDLVRTLAILGIIVGLVVVAITMSTRQLVTQPIEKLIAGIDDVAHGDLSHVVLSERDDEIGALATRFNEMTFSLRESQAETKRQNEAKMQLEQRLFQTEKLATIGQLAAEIAHEVGTPLNVIAGRARALARKSGGDETVSKNANIIADQAGRITRIIQRLLDFTRRKVGHIEEQRVNLNEITFTTMEFLEGKFAGSRVKTKLSRAEALPAVEGNPDKLQQVFLNLFLNAIESMPDGGSLAVETTTTERQRPGLEVAPTQRYVVVEVSDTGKGIPAEDRDKIFEPFYTSRATEGGTGLGLAVSQGIIKECDGWIELDESPQGGARFRVFLPAAS